MIIGFGKCETDEAIKILNKAFDNLEGCKTEKSAKKSLDDLQKEYANAEKEYKKMSREEAPERYSYFWYFYHEVYEGKYFVEFTFHHINRKHALSPDGWALLKTKWILSVCPTDGKRMFKEA